MNNEYADYCSLITVYCSLFTTDSVKNFLPLEKKLSINFKNKDLLIQAFTHRSYLNEHPNFYLDHNERLEFLGDAVLELIVTQEIYQDYPQKTEGELTSWRAALVNAKMLSKIAQRLGFNDFLLLSQGEAKEAGKARQCILANSFEAFIGAFYLDQGLNPVRKFVKIHLIEELAEIIEKGFFKDAKSRFQEQAQEIENITPVYETLKTWGPDHAKSFIIGVFLGKEKVAEGQGSSKQEGEEGAAKNALEVKGW